MTHYTQFQGPGYQLQVPSDWQNLSAPQIQALFVAPTAEAPIPATVAIVVRAVQADAMLKTIAEQLREHMPDEYPAFELLRETPVTISGQPALAFHYRWYSTEQQLCVEQRQLLVAHEQWIYIVLATRPEGTPSAIVDQMQHMENSFTLQA